MAAALLLTCRSLLTGAILFRPLSPLIIEYARFPSLTKQDGKEATASQQT
jgi:hypothetical protein